MIDAIDTLCHEFDVNFVLGGEPGAGVHESTDQEPDHWGLAPYYAINRIVKQSGGSRRAYFSAAERRYVATLWYQQESGIGALNHPSCDLETIREYRVTLERVSKEDPVGNESGDIHIAPRAPEMVDRDGEPISIPEIVGINARVQASNIPFECYGDLFRAAMTALGLDERFVDDDNLHAFSNINQAARNVRIRRDDSGPLHGRDGAIARIANLASDDRSGYRKLVQDDTVSPGYYHAATVDGDRAGELVERHRYPKEVKHYLPRKPEAFDEDHPLYHPKLEVSLATGRLDSNPRWADLQRVSRELDELLINVLRWAGYPVLQEDLDADQADVEDNRGSPGLDTWGPYVADAYFEPRLAQRNRRLGEDPTPELEQRQDNVVIRALRDGLEDSDVAVIETLLSDGGTVAPADVADKHDYHLETIYRALARLEALVEHQYADLRLHSHHVADQLMTAIDRAEDAAVDAAETAATVLTGDLDRVNDALSEWADRHGVRFEDPVDDSLTIDLGEVGSREDARELLHQGRRLWLRAGFDVDRYDTATARLQVLGGATQFYERVGDLFLVEVRGW